MNETRGREAEAMASDFTRRIKEKCPIVDVADSKTFALDIISRNPPPGFLTRLADAHQHWGQPTFYRDLRAAGEKVKEIVDDTPYFLAITGYGKSDHWISAQLLQNHGIPPPQELFSAHSGPELDNLCDIDSLDKHASAGSLLVFIDDVAISGGTVLDVILSESPQEKYDIGIVLLRATASAVAKVESNGVSPVVVGDPVLTLEESLSYEDLDFLRLLDKKLSPPESFMHEVYKNDSLFTSWYKVPDNYPAVLSGGRYNNFPPLVRRENLRPPYKKINML